MAVCACMLCAWNDENAHSNTHTQTPLADSRQTKTHTQIHICKNHKFIRNKSLSYSVLRRINYFIIIIIFTVQVRQQSEAWMIFEWNASKQSNFHFGFHFCSAAQFACRNRTNPSNFNGNSFFIQWQMRHNSLTLTHLQAQIHAQTTPVSCTFDSFRWENKIGRNGSMMDFRFDFFLNFFLHSNSR